MDDATVKKRCLACDRDDQATPLVALDYRGRRVWICPQHLPVLINDPVQLVGKLVGTEQLKPADHHD